MRSNRHSTHSRDTIIDALNHKRSMSIPSASMNNSQNLSQATGEEDLQREIEHNLVQIQLVAR